MQLSYADTAVSPYHHRLHFYANHFICKSCAKNGCKTRSFLRRHIFAVFFILPAICFLMNERNDVCRLITARTNSNYEKVVILHFTQQYPTNYGKC